MADMSTITLDNTVYNIKDVTAREEMSGMRKIFVGNQTPSEAEEGDLWFCSNKNVSGGEWVRPPEWPPYANDFDSSFEGCYLIYDLSQDNNLTRFYSFRVTATGGFTIEEGYIDGNGVFTTTATRSSQSGTTYGLLPTWDGTTSARYFVVRITAANNITQCVLISPTNAQQNTIYGGTNIQHTSSYRRQPLIEVYGRLPHVTSMTGGFGSERLMHVNLIDLESITDLSAMFSNDYKLERIDGLETWNTSNVTKISSIFQGCRNLSDLSGIERWDVKKVTDMSSAFYSCGVSGELDLSAWLVTTDLVSMQYLFRDCQRLKAVKAPNGNFSNVTSAYDLFRECVLLESITLPTQFKITQNIGYMFDNCATLREINNFSALGGTSPTTLQRLFNACYSLSGKLDLSGIDTSDVTSIASIFNSCYNVSEIDFTGCDFSAITNTETNMLVYCYYLQRLKGFIYYKSFSLSTSTLMSGSALVEVLTNLPTITSTQTLTLGNTNKSKLTDAEKAIATQKGWTIA